jgi:hypothetical protein
MTIAFTDSRSIPQIPRASGVRAPLGAFVGGALAGVVVGLSAGPDGLHIGAAVGAGVGLLVLAVLRLREALRSPETRRFLLRLVGWTFAAAGAGSAVVTGILMSDDPLDVSNVPCECVLGTAALFCVATIFFGSSARPEPQSLR